MWREADTMQMFMWQEDLFVGSILHCACMKHHATLLEGEDPSQPSWGTLLPSWMNGIHFLSVFTQV